MSQTAIKPGKPKVLGVNGQHSGLLNVEVPLDPRPDRYWTEIFNRGPANVEYSLSMHPLTVSGDKVRLQPPDDEVERYVEQAKRQIEGANREYAERIEPQLRAQKEAAEHAEAERRRRIEDAQRLLDQQQGEGVDDGQ